MTGPHHAKLVAFAEVNSGLVYRYRCCDDPCTDSTFTLSNPHLTADADREIMLQFHAANIESRHEAKLAVESHLSAFLNQAFPTPLLSADGVTVQSRHNCSLMAVEHVADEIIRCRYSCCGAGSQHWHSELIDHIPWHTLDEVNKFRINHMFEAARRCAVRTISASIRASLPTGTAT